MKLSDAIAMADRMKPNAFPTGEKARWLSELDGTLWEELIRWVPGREKPELPYLADRDSERELLADGEYADLYVKYLCAQVDFANGDFSRYNASASMYQAAYEGYAGFLRRLNNPRRTGRFHNF